METKRALLSAKWLERYGYKPPEWINNLEDSHKTVNACQGRILDLSIRLQEERALLQLLQAELDLQAKTSENTTCGPDYQSFQEAAKTPPCRHGEYGSEEKEDVLTFERHEPSPFQRDKPFSVTRRRVLGQVDRRHERVARRVKEKVKDKHWSISEIETLFEHTTINQAPLEEDNEALDNYPLEKKPLIRQRSRSESSVCGEIEVHTNTPVFTSHFLSPRIASKVAQVNLNPSVSTPMDVPGGETKRLSNGSGLHVSDDENDFVSSVKTVVGEDTLIPLRRSLADIDPTVTLKRDAFLERSTTSSGSGDKTPTDMLIDTSIKEEDSSETLCLSKAGDIYHHEQGSFDDDEDDDDDEKQSEDAGSVNEMDTSGYHSTFQNLAESTLTYILRDTIFASRSNSMSSLNDSRRSLSPEPTTPLGGVSLRPNSGRIKERNRAAQVLENQLNDEGIDEERLHMMLLEIQDPSSPCRSPSPVSSSYSDPSSPTHLVPYDHIHQVSQ